MRPSRAAADVADTPPPPTPHRISRAGLLHVRAPAAPPMRCRSAAAGTSSGRPGSPPGSSARERHGTAYRPRPDVRSGVAGGRPGGRRGGTPGADRADAPPPPPPPRGLLCDIDGVLATDSMTKAVPGAAATVAWARRCGVPMRLVTNTTSRTRRQLADDLTALLGVLVTPRDIVTPTVLAAAWLRQEQRLPVALLVAPGLEEDFVGLRVLDDGAESGAAAVVVGDLGDGWTYGRMNRALRLLLDDSAPGGRPALVALGKSRYYNSRGGLSLDVGAFAAALEFASGTAAVVCGKPDAGTFLGAARQLGVRNAAAVVMVGDDAVGDVAAAQTAGLQGVLVRTGKFRAADLQMPGFVPTGTLASVAELPAWWEARQRR